MDASTGETDRRFHEFASSVAYDVRLYPHDLDCTGAWATALAESGIITEKELAAIRSALLEISEELDAGALFL